MYLHRDLMLLFFYDDFKTLRVEIRLTLLLLKLLLQSLVLEVNRTSELELSVQVGYVRLLG